MAGSRPNIPPSSGPPRLPISIEGGLRASRALPSPTSPRSPFPPSQHQHQHEHHIQHSPRHHHPSHPHPGQDRHYAQHLPLPLPSSPARPWEDGYPASPRGMYTTAAPHGMSTDHGMAMHHFWATHDQQPPAQPLTAAPTPRLSVSEHELALPLPPRSLSTSELPRKPDGTKKQQSGRKRTACDRCKRQKSSCIEAYIEDPRTGKRRFNPDEKRCQRCVEKGVAECIITMANDSYARPKTPRMMDNPGRRGLSTDTPIIPPPLFLGGPPSHPPSVPGAHHDMPDGRRMSAWHDTASEPPSAASGADTARVISPESETQSQVSRSSGRQLFEEDPSVRPNLTRAVASGSDGQERGLEYFGNSHMGPAFVQDFVNAPRDNSDMVSVPAPSPRRRRPDYRAEKLLKHLPGNEKEMDRYVDRFFTKYNCWADVIDETDFRSMYTLFKRDHCSGTLAREREPADLRDLSLLFMVVAFGVKLDHVPKEEGVKRSHAILAALPDGEDKETFKSWLQEKDEASMPLDRHEEMSAFWAALAKECLVDAQSASMGETINSISAWVLRQKSETHRHDRLHGTPFIVGGHRKAGRFWAKLHDKPWQADGSHPMFQASASKMAPKEVEQRRRLWAHMVIIDTSISLYLGRPHAVFGGQQYTSQEPANIAGDDMLNPPPVSQQLVDDAADRSPWELDLDSAYLDGVRGRPLHTPTRSTFLILHLRLAYVIGRMQLQCFGVKPRKHDKDVVECEAMFESWANALPPHFRFNDTDRSLDDKPGYEWLKHQRKNLHSKYYIARISLHRPYLLAADSGGSQSSDRSGSPETSVNRYKMSQDACIVSAVADLNLRTQTEEPDPLDRFKGMTVASGFNPALIMGVVCFHHDQHHKYQVQELLRLLEKYLEVESKTLRKGPVLHQELRALWFLHKSARVHIKLGNTGGDRKEKKRRSSAEMADGGGSSSGSGERVTKRPRPVPAPVRPFTTSTPLQTIATLPPSVPGGVGVAAASASAIPLPVAHPQAQGIAPMPSAPTAVPPAQALAPFPHVPLYLQGPIKDFSFGDTDTMSFNEQFGLNTVQSQYNWPSQSQWLNMGSGFISNTDMWSATPTIASSSTVAQVMSTFNKAGQDVSPEQPLSELPFIDHLQHQQQAVPTTIQPSLLFADLDAHPAAGAIQMIDNGNANGTDLSAGGQLGFTQAWASSQTPTNERLAQASLGPPHV